MKLITTGAAMASNVPIAPDDKPDSRPMTLVTSFSAPPNIAGSMRLPVGINGEFGSVKPAAICDHDTGPVVLEATYPLFCAARRCLRTLLAKPPSSAAIDDSMPRADRLLGLTQRMGDFPDSALVQHV